MNIATANVFELGLQALQEEVAKLNKRASKHGLTPIELKVEHKPFIPVFYGRFLPQRDLYVVTIVGDAPVIDGWRLVARVEFNDTIGPVVRLVPGQEDDGSFSEYRKATPKCDHCNTARRRKDVFVLEKEGRRKVVGRNCLADFLRCGTAETLVKMAELSDSARTAIEAAETGDMDYFGGTSIRTMRLESYLPVVAMLSSRIGWSSRTKSVEGMATADLAYEYLFNNSSHTDKWIKENGLYANNQDRAIAESAIQWAKELDGDNEYLHTIGKIARGGVVDFSGLDGYAASIIVAYKNHCEKEQKKAKENNSKVFYGEEKKRYRGVLVTCKGIHTFDGYYGPTTLVRFVAGNAVLVWFASGAKEYDWETDTEYTVDFTVKAHENNERFGKQTKINRVKAK